MTNEDLFIAIGNVRPRYLEQSGEIPIRVRQRPSRLILIAALVAALTCTVLGAAAIRNYLLRIDQKQTNRPGAVSDYRGETVVYEGRADINLSLDLVEDRPGEIEEYWLPMYFPEKWEAVVKERPAGQERTGKETMNDMKWTDSDGNYAIFTQNTVDQRIPADCEEYPFDVIFTGYNDTFESGTMELGAYEVFFVEVKPSSFTSGERVYTSDGYRKFYWSDGLYIFTLETSFAVTDDVVRMALESFAPVDDISEYESVRLVEPDTPTEPTSGPVVQEIWFPTHIPQGWRMESGVRYDDGCCEFVWKYAHEDTAIESYLELAQFLNDSGPHSVYEWETGNSDYTKQIHQIGDWTVSVYSADKKVQAFWVMDGYDYVLTMKGTDKAGEIDTAEVIRIIGSMERIESTEGLFFD